jgi:hypothetical protein
MKYSTLKPDLIVSTCLLLFLFKLHFLKLHNLNPQTIFIINISLFFFYLFRAALYRLMSKCSVPLWHNNGLKNQQGQTLVDKKKTGLSFQL